MKKIVLALIVFSQSCSLLLGTHNSSSLLASLSLREKIAQLLMVGAYSYEAEADKTTIEKLITEQHIGSLIFMSGIIEKQYELTKHYQSLSKLPLLIATDAEWGPAMRLISQEQALVKFPFNMTLGALRDISAIKVLGYEIGRELRQIGVHMNLAPVIDINSNWKNPVINHRSFGDSPDRVAACGILYAQGLAQAGELPCFKHFFGHGDVAVDSHHDLPYVDRTAQELLERELVPFKKAFEACPFSACMIAHLAAPKIGTTPDLPSSLDPKIVTDLLRTMLGFKGLVITDSLNMKAITSHFSLPQAALAALKAGNDILLFCDAVYDPQVLYADMVSVIDTIESAVTNGEVTLAELDRHVMRVLEAKAAVNLFDTKGLAFKEELNAPFNLEAYSLSSTLDGARASQLAEKLYRDALTVLDEHHLIPLKAEHKKSIACVTIGGKHPILLSQALGIPAQDSYYLMAAPSGELVERLVDKVKHYETVIIVLNALTNDPSKQWNCTGGAQVFIGQIKKAVRNTVIILLGNVYSASLFDKSDTLVIAYENNDYTQQAAADVLDGSLVAHGSLPVVIPQKEKGGKSVA